MLASHKDRNKRMYVYLDETTFGEEDEYSGYACLITKSRIEETVIFEALNDLGADPDITKEEFKKTMIEL